VSQRKSTKSRRAASVRFICRRLRTGTLESSGRWSASRPKIPPGRSETAANSYVPGFKLVKVMRALGSSRSGTKVKRCSRHWAVSSTFADKPSRCQGSWAIVQLMPIEAGASPRMRKASV